MEDDSCHKQIEGDQLPPVRRPMSGNKSTETSRKGAVVQTCLTGRNIHPKAERPVATFSYNEALTNSSDRIALRYDVHNSIASSFIGRRLYKTKKKCQRLRAYLHTYLHTCEPTFILSILTWPRMRVPGGRFTQTPPVLVTAIFGRNVPQSWGSGRPSRPWRQ